MAKRGRGRPKKLDQDIADWSVVLFRSYVNLAVLYGHSEPQALKLAGAKFYSGQEKRIRNLRRTATKSWVDGRHVEMTFGYSGDSPDREATDAEKIANLERFLLKGLDGDKCPPKPTPAGKG
jgi:hypothetical protein